METMEKNIYSNVIKSGALRILLTVYEIKSLLTFEIQKTSNVRVTDKMTLFYYYLSLNDAPLNFHYYQKVEYKHRIRRRFVLSSSNLPKILK